MFPAQGKGTPAFCCLGKLHLDETEPQQNAPNAPLWQRPPPPITGLTGWAAAAGKTEYCLGTMIGNPDEVGNGFIPALQAGTAVSRASSLSALALLACHLSSNCGA